MAMGSDHQARIEELRRRDTREVVREGFYTELPDLEDAPLSRFVNDDETPETITPALCEWLREEYETTDRSYQSLADSLGVDYRAVYGHVNGGCDHRKYVSARECDVIRDAAADGWSHGRIARTFSFVGSRRAVSDHAAGECGCDGRLPPVESDGLPENFECTETAAAGD